MKPKQLARTTVYRSPWINLHLDRVQLPSGNVIEEYHVLDFPREAVGVIVTDGQGQLLLVHAHRYVTGDSGWEVPAGRIEGDEGVLEAARREVLEETGYDTRDHEHAYSFNPSNGMCNQMVHVVRCLATVGSGRFDSDEVGEYRWFRREEITAMVGQREIRCGLTLVALLLAGDATTAHGFE